MLRAATIALLAIGCSGSPVPGAVDEEALAADVSLCARKDPACLTSGEVFPIELLYPGEGRAVALRSNGKISLPLQKPSPGAKLAWLAIGVRAEGGDHRLRVSLTGSEPVLARPNWGFFRVEVAYPNTSLPDGARIELAREAGNIDVLWIVGRWKH